MHNKTTAASSFLTVLALLAACGRDPDLPPDVASARALAEQIMQHTGGRMLDGAADEAFEAPRPAVEHRSADSLDPGTLLTEKDVIAVLKQQRAGGDGTDTAVWKVSMEREERPTYRGSGQGMVACKVSWSATAPGESFGAQGNFVVGVVDVPHFDLLRGVDSTPLPGIGDEAFTLQGTPYVRVGDLALTVENTTCGNALSIDVLRRAASRMK